MLKLRFLLLLAGMAGLATTGLLAQSPGQPQGPGRGVAPVQTGSTSAFHASNYEIHASLDAAGRPVSYDRDDNDAQKLDINLTDTIPAGGKVSLQFDYGGTLSGRVTTPQQEVRLGHIGKDGGYLLLPARWFPLTDFPSNRYTGVFQIEVPGTMTVVGTGTSTGPPTSVTPRPTAPPSSGAVGNARPGASAPMSPLSAPPPPSLENERMLYTFRVDKPQAAGTFVVAPLQLSPVHAAGSSFSVYTPPAAAATAQSYADSVEHIIDYYNGEFGALPEPGLKIAQLPDGTVDGFAAPGTSEEHTSELQSQSNIVCRPLLEKKKQKNKI